MLKHSLLSPLQRLDRLLAVQLCYSAVEQPKDLWELQESWGAEQYLCADSFA